MQETDSVLNYFKILKIRNLLGSSYLFLGDNYNLIFEIIKLISCQADGSPCNSCFACKQIKELNHPDLCIVETEGFNIKIDAIRQGMRFLTLRSFSLPRKILLIRNAKSMSLPAANAFLKTLEEPPGNSFIAVCASDLEGILPTIISRCRKIFLPLDREGDQVAEYEKVVSFLRGENLQFRDRNRFISFLWSFILMMREDIVSSLSSRNNKLLNNRECEIILSSYGRQEKCTILEGLLNIYQVSKTVNMNLALNLIRNKL